MSVTTIAHHHHTDRAYRPQTALLILLVVQFALGIARLQIVPPGYNVDEFWHFAGAKNVAAACMRDLIGLEWSIFRDEDVGFDAEQWALVLPNQANAAPCKLLFHYPHAHGIAYYIWSGLPLAVFNSVSDVVSITLLRVIHLVLGLGTTTLCHFTARQLFPQQPMLTLGTTITVGLNHHMADIMSGVNDEAGAIFAITFLIWVLVRLRRRGVSASQVLLMIIALGLCFMTKTTAWIGLPLLLLWCWASLPILMRRWSLAGASLAAAILLLVVKPFDWTVPAHWFAYNNGWPDQTRAAARTNEVSTLGNYALAVRSDKTPQGYVQYIPEAQLELIQGRQVTVGGWVWAPLNSVVPFPAIQVGSEIISSVTLGDGKWQFRAMTANIDSRAAHFAVLLPASKNIEEVRYDEIILTPGEYRTNELQALTDHLELGVTLGDEQLPTNLLRNPSAEQTWPKLRFERVPTGVPEINQTLWSLMSWVRTGAAWRQVPVWLFVMHWSGFGGVFPGLSPIQLLPHACLTLLAAVGLVGTLLKFRPLTNTWQFGKFGNRELRLILVSALLLWLPVVLRSEIHADRAAMFAFAGARYGLPGILPTMALFSVGIMTPLPRQWQQWLLAGIILLMFVSSVYILLEVQIPFYDCATYPDTECLISVQ